MNRTTSPVMTASPTPIAACTSAIQLRMGKKSARRPEAPSSRANAPAPAAPRTTPQPSRRAGSPAAADRAPDRRVDRVAAHGTDQSHVDEVGPEGRQPAVAEEQALHDQHGADDHRARPGAEHHRREHSAQQVPRDPRADGKLDHLRGEDERRHDPRQNGRPVAQPVLKFAQAGAQTDRGHGAGHRGHVRTEHGIRNVHRRASKSTDPGGNLINSVELNRTRSVSIRQKLHTEIAT